MSAGGSLRVREAMKKGIAAQCKWSIDIKHENRMEIFETLHSLYDHLKTVGIMEKRENVLLDKFTEEIETSRTPSALSFGHNQQGFFTSQCQFLVILERSISDVDSSSSTSSVRCFAKE
ncbi:hypothetical protein C5167_005511 [Papaver somniferum]|uniref:Uncharacterized protein n=1 Tax=Papaver somniferum TaxID=3469 RepID=A0A4Y7JEM1_PAPSO|nr:hypothetical protein C5167_005511 [Papaver somniferum]